MLLTAAQRYHHQFSFRRSLVFSLFIEVRLMYWFAIKICDRFISDPGWNIVRDPFYQAPYAYKGNLWIGYDDEESLKAKVSNLPTLSLK